jgi:hypothetical protein
MPLLDLPFPPADPAPWLVWDKRDKQRRGSVTCKGLTNARELGAVALGIPYDAVDARILRDGETLADAPIVEPPVNHNADGIGGRRVA